MPEHSEIILAVLFLVVGALYSSVGHAGGSGYLAAMALLGVPSAMMRSTSLSLNVIVSILASVQFYRAGHFRWRLFWPFALMSIPLAYLGGTIELAPKLLKPAIGIVLLLSAARIVVVTIRKNATALPTREPPLPVAFVAGGAIGLASGLTGTGGGIFLSPLILLLRWADPKQTAAVSALFILVNSISGIAGLATKGWSPPAALPLWAVAAAIGGLIGATYGSRMASNQTIRVLLALVLVIAGAKLIFS